MGSIVAFLVFGMGLVAAVMTIVTTIMPQASRIAALLNDRADIGTLPALPPVRSGGERIIRRPAAHVPAAYRRAAA